MPQLPCGESSQSAPGKQTKHLGNVSLHIHIEIWDPLTHLMQMVSLWIKKQVLVIALLAVVKDCLPLHLSILSTYPFCLGILVISRRRTYSVNHWNIKGLFCSTCLHNFIARIVIILNVALRRFVAGTRMWAIHCLSVLIGKYDCFLLYLCSKNGIFAISQSATTHCWFHSAMTRRRREN